LALYRSENRATPGGALPEPRLKAEVVGLHDVLVAEQKGPGRLLTAGRHQTIRLEDGEVINPFKAAIPVGYSSGTFPPRLGLGGRDVK